MSGEPVSKINSTHTQSGANEARISSRLGGQELHAMFRGTLFKIFRGTLSDTACRRQESTWTNLPVVKPDVVDLDEQEELEAHLRCRGLAHAI